MKPDFSIRGMGVVIALCALVGLVTVAATLAFGRISLPNERKCAGMVMIPQRDSLCWQIGPAPPMESSVSM